MDHGDIRVLRALAAIWWTRSDQGGDLVDQIGPDGNGSESDRVRRHCRTTSVSDSGRCRCRGAGRACGSASARSRGLARCSSRCRGGFSRRPEGGLGGPVLQLLATAREITGVTIHDLYEAYPTLDIDVVRAQRLLVDHDVIVFQHPFYWYSAPAILNEWQDLVLEHDWAYGQ